MSLPAAACKRQAGQAAPSIGPSSHGENQQTRPLSLDEAVTSPGSQLSLKQHAPFRKQEKQPQLAEPASCTVNGR